MRISFITGTLPMSGWDEYLSQLDLFQTDELLRIYQAAFDRYRAINPA